MERQAFTINFNGDSKTTEITLLADPTQAEWTQITDCYKQKIAAGCLFWDLDLRALDWMGTISIGMIVSLNTSLCTRNGSLRLVLQKDSRIAALIQLTKLDRIISVAVL